MLQHLIYNLHMYALVYLSGLLSMDAIYDIPIVMRAPIVDENGPGTRLLVDAHIHYVYSMPHPVASHIIPCCVVVVIVGVVSTAVTRRSVLSILVLLLTVVGAAAYVIFEPAAEKILPYIPRVDDNLAVSTTDAEVAASLKQIQATIPPVSLQHVTLLAMILVALILLQIDNALTLSEKETSLKKERAAERKQN